MRKRDRLVTCLEGAALSFLMGMSAISCLVTAFDMNGTDLWFLAGVCAAAALLCGICFSFRLGLVPLCLLALAAGFLWQSGLLVQGAESLLYRLSRTYHDGYGWGILRWSYRTAEELEATLPSMLYMLGGLITVITAWSVCKGRSALWAALAALPPVLACFVVTDTLPELSWLFLFMVDLLVLMLCSTTRCADPVQGNRLTAMVFLPVVLAVGLLFYMIPAGGYDRQEQAEALSEQLFGESPLEELWADLTNQVVTSGSSVDGSTVDLSRIGYRHNSQAEILRLNTRYTGTVYLRGRALDSYTGTQWQDAQSGAELYWPEEGDLTPVGEVVITTRYAHRMLYLPYYVTSINTQGLTRGVENKEKLTMYSFTCRYDGGTQRYHELYPDRTTAPADTAYANICTQLPEAVLAWAGPLAAQIVGDAVSPYHQAQAIARYVRQSATYDLETTRMPTRHSDFAKWFLEESDTGYCVHFATAATVLLKAAGIPARYASGYMVQAEKSKTVVVREEDAHAWVEYWLPGFGWTVLEATPPAQPQSPATESVTVAPTEVRPTVPQAVPPVTTPDRQPVEKTEARWLTALLWTASILLAVGLLLLQWRLRVRWRNKRLGRGTANRQLLFCWQEVTRLCRLLNGQPPKALCQLAEKARFSQHTVTQEELSQLQLFLDTARQRLRRRNLLWQLYYTLVLAVY